MNHCNSTVETNIIKEVLNLIFVVQFVMKRVFKLSLWKFLVMNYQLEMKKNSTLNTPFILCHKDLIDYS